MRKDYKYIEEATSLCMTTTEKGHVYLDNLSDDEIDETTDLNELLLYIEDEYIVLPNNSDIDDWIKIIQKSYDDEFIVKPNPLTKEIIIEGIQNGYIGFKVVIWDESLMEKIKNGKTET